MKKAEVELPDAIYQHLEKLAGQRRLTVAEILCKAAEQLVNRQPRPPRKQNGGWQFPEGRHLGAFRAPVEDWRLLANEAAD